MQKSECPYCEYVFSGSYEDREAKMAEHLEYDHAPEDAPSADNGYTPPRSKHGPQPTGRKIT